ncbi:alpha/beta hydrolase [Syntrophomonas palmitatica]|uniref:alpha/beta hydrolase n=1 Tax=Syntrophomonas palmitatica TaxID=402877 RepID=UPI0006D1E86B|nr:alpha/beta fold hydrolase [Syntrophomonas palmitatica]
MEQKIIIERYTRQKRKRTYIIIPVVIVLLAGAGVFSTAAYTGWNLTHPDRLALCANPQSVGLDYENVEFNSRDDAIQLKGWLIPATNSNKTIIFAHGYRRNRADDSVPMLDLARDMVQRGYNVLLFDFRNSGESGGHLTTVGQYEVRDLLGAIDYVKTRPQISRDIVLLGFSMGASTSLLAGARDTEVDAVIADAPFADMQSYLNDNLSIWTDLPSFPFNQAFFIIVPLFTGLDPDQVSPINEIKNFKGRPVLLIHGTADSKIPISNSEALKEAYPKAQLLKVPGSDHCDSYHDHPDLYLKTLEQFLSKV